MPTDSLRSLSRSTLILALLPLASDAAAQLTPVATPSAAPKQAAPPLPPPVSVSEQRYREMSAYVRSRRTIDEAMRKDLQDLARRLDEDIAAPTSTLEMVQRLCPARVQVAIWLGDDDAMHAAFAKLTAVLPASDAAALAWARESVGSGDFDRAIDVLAARTFAPDRMIDVEITRALALLGLHRFEEAQAVLNGIAPQGRSPQQQSLISSISERLTRLKALWYAEQNQILKDQALPESLGLPVVEFVTSKGPVEIELFEDQAPNTVGNFIEHVERGTYAGTTFHRRLRGLGVQGGDPATAGGDAGGRSTGGWTVPDEADRPDRRGMFVGRVILAKQPNPADGTTTLPNSGGCQFFFLFTPSEQMDGQFTAFGRVVEGWETVRRLGPEDSILSAQVVRKRAHDYKGVRLGESAGGDFSMPRLGSAGVARVNETKVTPAPLVTPNAASPSARPAGAAPIGK